jgi:hypothetical protein
MLSTMHFTHGQLMELREPAPLQNPDFDVNFCSAAAAS